jgi:fructose-1-phosphate kinase PfkB-like protein
VHAVTLLLTELHPFASHQRRLPPLVAAGDAYAAGLLYGYLAGADLVSMGRTAARVASAVISKHGAALSADAAAALAESLPGASRRAAAPALAPSTP